VKFNFNQFSLSFPDTERYGGFVNAEHKVWGDRLIAYADLFYQNVKVHNELAASATGPFLAPGSTTLFIPPQNPVNGINPATGQPFGTTGGLSADEVGAPPGAFNPFNPFQQFISGGAALQDFGDRLIENETDAFMTTLGLKGEQLFDGTWGYDAGFRYSEIRNTSTGTFVSSVLFDRILNANDPIFDPSSNQYIGTTIPFNPFTDYRVPFRFQPGDDQLRDRPPEGHRHLKTRDPRRDDLHDGVVPAAGGWRGLALAASFAGKYRAGYRPPENGESLAQAQPTAPRPGENLEHYVETDIPIFSPANSVPAFTP
jgi:hypothetical protein